MPICGQEKKMNSANLYDVWENIVKKAMNECESDSQNIYVPYGSCEFGMTFISTNRLKNKALYIEVESYVVDKIKLPQIKGLSFEFISVPAIDSSKIYLKVSLTNTNVMEEAFEAFTVSVFNSIQDITNSFEAVDVICQLVYDYEEFFGSEKEKRLTKQEEQGLFGELLFLESVLDKKGEDYLSIWTGPQKNKHDFISPNNIGVEVKTTGSQSQKNILISNENQLKFEDRAKLFLVLYVLEINPNGENIIDLYKRILDKLATNKAKRLFNEKLLEFGIDPNSYFARYSFIMVSKSCYQINASFPRISKEQIDPSIFDVKYRVNVDHIPVFNGDVYEEL